MRNIYHIQTPENVTLEFELAGIGSRGIAVAIDTVIQNAILSVIAIIIVLISGDEFLNMWFAKENTIYIVIGLILIFLVQFGYFLLFEYFMKGLTPGKKLIGLKVMMANGEPVSFTGSIIRNLIRIGDMLPGIYGVGIFSAVLTERYMRIGDLAANTVVIKVNKRKTDFQRIQNINSGQQDIDISQSEEALLIEYNKRLKDLKNPIYSSILESQLYHHFYGKIGSLPNLSDKYSKRLYLKKLMKYLGIT